MKRYKLYYVRTNGYDMVLAVDDEKNLKYLNIPSLAKNENEALDFLAKIDMVDNTWEDDVDCDTMFNEIDKFNEEILAEIQTEI